MKLNSFEKYARQNGFIFPNFRGENLKKIETTTAQVLKIQPPFAANPLNPKKGCVKPSKLKASNVDVIATHLGFFGRAELPGIRIFSLKKNLPSGKLT